MKIFELAIGLLPAGKLQEWLWNLLPDNCSIPERNTYITCNRKGTRGNENRIPVGNEEWVMCDYCTVKWQDKFKSSVS